MTERDCILAALTTNPQTAPQLARAARVNPCSIYQHLWSLRDEGLAACEERPAGRTAPRLFWRLGQPQSPQPRRPLAQQAQPDEPIRQADELIQEAQPQQDQAPARPQILEGSASLDPRKEPPLTLPGGRTPPTKAARAAAERMARRVTVHGLTWTYRPIAGLTSMWEIVESARQEDERLPGCDVCERRLQRWAREGFCPPRKDGLTPPTFAPTPPRKEARP